MALIDRVKERVGLGGGASDLSDTELQAMIDAITVELDARLGPAGEITVELGDLDDPVSRMQRTLRLNRPIDVTQPVTIIEDEPADSGLALARTTLDPTDFRVLHGGRTVQRLTGGPNGRSFWAPLVTITYAVAGAAAARDEATIKLIQLDLSYRGGLKSERAGDYQFTLSGDPVADREAIIAALGQRGGMVMA